MTGLVEPCFKHATTCLHYVPASDSVSHALLVRVEVRIATAGGSRQVLSVFSFSVFRLDADTAGGFSSSREREIDMPIRLPRSVTCT